MAQVWLSRLLLKFKASPCLVLSFSLYRERMSEGVCRRRSQGPKLGLGLDLSLRLKPSRDPRGGGVRGGGYAPRGTGYGVVRW